ncbi:MAG: glycogen synthase, partial [Clostridia bacterium]|nr:glycogen synthase [Clostridia bacterium]
RQYCGIFEARAGGVIYYLLDNQYYFKRDALYGFYDDAERFAFFSRAILEILPHIDFKPDIIHCNDWQTALTPLYYSTMYANQPGYENIKTVLTIHNIQYQGVYGEELLDNVVGIDHAHKSLIEYDGAVNLMKGGIECANAVTTVSPSYAKEILDPWYSHGLDTILRERSYKLRGILNGIDVENYNPETDKDVFKNYSVDNMRGKAVNKRELQKLLGLPEKSDTPVMGMVSRLVSHKGLDLCKAVLDELLSTTDIQLVVLGSGDYQYEEFFRGLAERYPDKVGLCLGFIPDLARKIYAGSDMFLMPSKSEPCGLSQMVALRYGSIPIVRETGGLRDSVRDSGDGEGNGFVFSSYNAHDMLHAIKRAVAGYQDKKGWPILVKRAMESDNSWGKSANEYIRMYKEVLKG